jgi:hypothetical protein
LKKTGPGEPRDWITVVGVTRTFDTLLEDKAAQPAVLAMPDANGGRAISLLCLNQAGGPQDLTYLAVDPPAQIARILRVQRPGSAWGVAGYPEGGFCAANMARRGPVDAQVDDPRPGPGGLRAGCWVHPGETPILAAR